MSARSTVAVIIDGRAGGDAVVRTVRRARALAEDSAAVSRGPVVVGAVAIVAPGDQVAGLPAARCIPIATTAGAALAAAVVAAPPADLVLHLAAGLEPTLADVEALVSSLLHRHVAALALTTLDHDGEVVRRPSGVAFTGHPLPSAVANDGDPTVALGDAYLVRRDELERAGGHDARLQLPAAAIDLGWRLWTSAAGAVVDTTRPLTGAAVSPVPGRPGTTDLVTAELDALRMAQRNHDSAAVGPAMRAALALVPPRLIALGCQTPPSVVIATFGAEQPGLDDERQVRATRWVRPAAEVNAVLGRVLDPDCIDPAFVAAHGPLADELRVDAGFGPRRRVVVATRDGLAPRMAGPGIRAFNLALALAADHDVRLVSMTQADLSHPNLRVEWAAPDGIAELVEWCDIFVFQGGVMAGQPSFARADRIFVVDVYDPLHLETLEQAKDHDEYERRKAVNAATRTLNEQLLRGDFFLCASGRQRDFWLGHLASLGRLNAPLYDRDETLRSVIDVVAFGIPDEAPVADRSAIKGVLPGVGPDDEVILWGGGVYNWFDPLALIHAIDRLRSRRPQVRLVFLGMRHPNPEVPEMRMAVAARELAAELGIAGTHVIFNEQWVAHEDRHNFLLDADIGVTTHLDHIETEFAYRTRVLDYLWTGLPTVATAGDALADLIERDELGITVPAGDVDALERALERLLDDHDFAARCRANIAAIRPQLTWSVVTEPLVAFCRAPRRAPDLVAGIVDVHGVMASDPPEVPVWRRYVQVVTDLAGRGEYRTLVRRGRKLIGRLARWPFAGRRAAPTGGLRRQAGHTGPASGGPLQR